MFYNITGTGRFPHGLLAAVWAESKVPSPPGNNPVFQQLNLNPHTVQLTVFNVTFHAVVERCDFVLLFALLCFEILPFWTDNLFAHRRRNRQKRRQMLSLLFWRGNSFNSMPHYRFSTMQDDLEKMINRRTDAWQNGCFRKIGWSSGSHHTKPPSFQSEFSSKIFSSNHPYW